MIQYTARNSNPLWRHAALTEFRAGAKLSGEGNIARATANARDVYSYLRSCREHRHMMNTYWPTSALTEEQKLARTAGTVGFQLPKMMDDEAWAKLNKKGDGAEQESLPHEQQRLPEQLDLPAGFQEALKMVADAGKVKDGKDDN
ncbi:hypothetical protein HK097_000160 [Rhizophlyctis rosea]|uniref:Uncharacterized protein n=1 Tax=Rhizophlyctis rosea TaxID=64517 RepID=A0AAD5S8G2_9FUNG|nr:hypothetical protein HK097_000160 [Rhizophlyctis rosea]